MTWTRLTSTWLLLALAMSLNGAFREAVLKRVMAPAAADVVSAVLGAAIILLVTRLFFRAFAKNSIPALLAASGVLVGLTVAFEFLVGRYVDHKTWAELLGNYAIWSGKLWPLLLLLVALTPFIWGRWWPRRDREVTRG